MGVTERFTCLKCNHTWEIVLKRQSLTHKQKLRGDGNVDSAAPGSILNFTGQCPSCGHLYIVHREET